MSGTAITPASVIRAASLSVSKAQTISQTHNGTVVRRSS